MDIKLTFENHISSIVSRSFQNIVLVKCAWRIFGSFAVCRRCFSCFVLNLLEYYSPVWLSTADCHLRLLINRVCEECCFYAMEGIVSCNLSHFVRSRYTIVRIIRLVYSCLSFFSYNCSIAFISICWCLYFVVQGSFRGCSSLPVWSCGMLLVIPRLLVVFLTASSLLLYNWDLPFRV